MRAESPFAWLSSGGLMPMHDTAGVVAALWEGGGFAPESLISEMTTADGTVAYHDNAGIPILTVAFDEQGRMTQLIDASGWATDVGFEMALGNGLSVTRVDLGEGRIAAEVRDSRGNLLRTGGSQGQALNVNFTTVDDGSGAETVRTVQYAYHSGIDPHGTAEVRKAIKRDRSNYP